jgi:hypothetical protein
MSAAIAGPAIIAASATLPSKNLFIVRPPEFPVGVVPAVAIIASLDADGCDISATAERIRYLITMADAGGAVRVCVQRKAPGELPGALA